MVAEIATYTLPKVMKIDDCAQLYQFLLGAQGQAVVLDCSEVSRLHGLGVQMIIMAAKLWHAASISFHLEAPSEDFVTGCKTLGLWDFLASDGDAA